MANLETFRNLHAGQRCVIVCNGPSLNGMDLDFLRDEVVFGLNKIYLGLEKFRFYPRYLVAVNEMVIAQAASALRAMTAIKFIGQRGTHHLSEDAFTCHIATIKPPDRFCRDITKGVHEGGTVTYAALQIAYYMGFTEVWIIGMDHRFVFQGRPNQPQVMQGPDPNHFSPDYFQGHAWNNPDLALSEKSYEIARDIFASEGRRILDATTGGACRIFERADYRAIPKVPRG